MSELSESKRLDIAEPTGGWRGSALVVNDTASLAVYVLYQRPRLL